MTRRIDFSLRPDLQLLRTGPQSFRLWDAVRGEHFDLGAEERHLVHWLEQSGDIKVVQREFRAKFGHDTSRRQILEFVEQLRQAGLLVQTGRAATVARTPIAEPAIALAWAGGGVTAPLSTAAPHANLNLCFDLLVALFGWLLYPLTLIPALSLVLVGLSVVWNHWDRMWRNLDIVWYESPSIAILVIASFIQTILLLNLPNALFIGMATRAYGGTVEGLGFMFWRGVIPLVHIDTGVSFWMMSDRDRRRYLWAQFLFPLVALGVFSICWMLSHRHPIAESFFVLMMAPCLLSFVLLQCNIFVPHSAYWALCNWLEDWRIHDKAVAEVKAWVLWNRSPEALTSRERFWLRIYGLCYYALRLVLDGGLIIVLWVYWVPLRFNWDTSIFGLALLATLCVAQGWGFDHVTSAFSEFSGLGRLFAMITDSLRWLVRGGGRWFIRWPLRLLLLAGIVACGFIPYKHEVGGDFRFIPVEEYPVRAQIPAEIDEVRIKPGEHITGQTVVATLFAADQHGNVATTKAELAEAKAKLDLALAGPRHESIEKTLQEVELCRTRLAYCQSELERIEGLATTNTVSQSQLENARYDRDTAQRTLAATQEELTALTNGTREEEIRAAQAEVERLEAQLAHYEVELKLADIAPPTDKDLLAVRVPARPGTYVVPGDMIAVLTDASRLRVEIWATEDAAVLVQKGQIVKLRMPGYRWGELLTAKIVGKAASTIDAEQKRVETYRSDREFISESTASQDNNRYLQIFAELDAPRQDFVPYMTGYARIVIKEDVFWKAVARPIVRFFRTEIWSWLP